MRGCARGVESGSNVSERMPVARLCSASLSSSTSASNQPSSLPCADTGMAMATGEEEAETSVPSAVVESVPAPGGATASGSESTPASERQSRSETKSDSESNSWVEDSRSVTGGVSKSAGA